MKTKLTFLALLSSFLLQPSYLPAQGSLTPPGAPAPTMKTLQQLEPRTPISSAPFTITNSGAYYLTTNVAVSGGDAITIATDCVTLDLNGFAISSTAPGATTDSAVLLKTNLQDITILNGSIISGVTNNGGVYNGGGFANGIVAAGGANRAHNVRVSRVSVSGCLFEGIFLDNFATVVESCAVDTVGDLGIYAQTVSDSTAINCGITGIYVYTARNCYGSTTGTGVGVNGGSVINCVGLGVSGYGVAGTAAHNCVGTCTAGGAGVEAVVANNCYGTSSSGYGVNATIANNSYGLSSGGIGLRCLNYQGYGIATGCFGQSSSSVGLNAYIANGCVGVGPTPISVSFKYNMP